MKWELSFNPHVFPGSPRLQIEVAVPSSEDTKNMFYIIGVVVVVIIVASFLGVHI